MPIDAVYDTQATYRLCVQALAMPGTIVDLAPMARRVDAPDASSRAAILLAHVLLDAETSFAVVSPDAAADADAVRQRTYARLAAVPEAAFVFVLGGQDPTAAIHQARVGTLEDPHLGATVVIEVDALAPGLEALHPTAGGSRGLGLVLRGPGVESVTSLAVAAPFDWVGARNARVRAYPLGIDLMLVDRHQQLVAIPRTTHLGPIPGST